MRSKQTTNTTKQMEPTEQAPAVADLSTEVQPSQDILAILNTADLTNTDISRPLLKDQSDVALQVETIKVVLTRDRTSNNIEIVLKTVNMQKSNKPGRDLNPGFKVFHRIPLKQIDKNGADRTEEVKSACAAFKLACTGTKAGSFMPLDQYLNRRVTARVIIDKDEGGQFGDKNIVARWIPPTGVKME
jgi:hypothetical protein